MLKLTKARILGYLERLDDMKARIENDELIIEAENIDENFELANWGKSFGEDKQGSLTLEFSFKIRENDLGVYFLENKAILK